MGLLDDAIREHLELKRLRGADPGEVARQERDVLGSAPAHSRAQEDVSREHERSIEGFSGERETTHPGSVPSSSHLTAGQETAELNMEAELKAGLDEIEPTPSSDEDAIKWDLPKGSSSQAIDKDADEEGEQAEGHVEDVLEETPDFLRDTPEQERLWFEQRPPRDFDFNE